jgi:signal transduction histidine kinase
MRGDAEHLRRVLINLVGNALDALEEAGTSSPVLQVMSGDNLAGDAVWVRVRDNGPGIDDATRAKIWSPFYTTKASGTGLGLALSRKIVDAHGGEMELHSAPGEGTEFVLTFPKDGSLVRSQREHDHAI